MSHDHDEKDAKGGELSQAVEEAISNMGEAFFYRDSADKRIAVRQALTKAIQADTARILADENEACADLVDGCCPECARRIRARSMQPGAGEPLKRRTLDEQIASARAEVNSWTPEVRTSMRLEGGTNG